MTNRVLLPGFFSPGCFTPQSGTVLGREADGWLRVRLDGTGQVITRSPSHCRPYRKAMRRWLVDAGVVTR